MNVPSIKRNATWLIVTEFITRFVLFYIVVQLTNTLGRTQYGQLSYVFAIANLCVVIADFGLHTYVTRLVASNLAEWQKQRHHILYLKFLGSLTAIILTLAIVSVRSQLDWITIFAGAVAIIAMSARTFNEAIVRGKQQMSLESASKLIHTTVQALALSLAIVWQLPLRDIAIAYALSALVGWLVSLQFIKRELHLPALTSTNNLLGITRSVLPFAASIAINAQFNYLDSAILGWLKPADQLGIYSAAYKPIFFLTSLAGLVIVSFFPKIAQLWKNHQLTEANQHVRILLRNLMLIGWPMAIVGSVLASWTIGLLYKPEYAAAVVPFTILLWSTLCIYFWAPLGNSLQAIGKEKLYTKNFIIAACLNAPLTLLCVWQWSYIGAAISTLLTQLALALLMYRDARHYFPLWKK